MPRIAAVHQPNFLPFAGYFAKMARADVFVLLDDAQFPKGSYANRVRIRGRDGEARWLTLPVRLADGSHLSYREMQVVRDRREPARLLNLLRDAYSPEAHFQPLFDDLAEVLRAEHASLADLNVALIRRLVASMGIGTPLVRASELGSDLGAASARNLEICRRVGADVYLSGHGARSYNDEAAFERAGIRLVYPDWELPEYPQGGGTFLPGLSVVDLLFRHGPGAAGRFGITSPSG